MCSQRSQDTPLSKGPIRTWEERRSFVYFSNTNLKGLFDLSADDLQRIQMTVPNLIQNAHINDSTISNALQFTAIGLESILFPHWSDKNTIVDTGTARAPTVDVVIDRGAIVRDVRSWKETLLNSTNQNPICYSIGLVANSMLEIVESCSLGLEFKNSQNILFFSRLFSDFSSFLKNNAELLIKNEANQDMNELIHLQQTSDSVFLYPLFVLIQETYQIIVNRSMTASRPVVQFDWSSVCGLLPTLFFSKCSKGLYSTTNGIAEHLDSRRDLDKRDGSDDSKLFPICSSKKSRILDGNISTRENYPTNFRRFGR